MISGAGLKFVLWNCRVLLEISLEDMYYDICSNILDAHAYFNNTQHVDIYRASVNVHEQPR